METQKDHTEKNNDRNTEINRHKERHNKGKKHRQTERYKDR